MLNEKTGKITEGSIKEKKGEKKEIDIEYVKKVFGELIPAFDLEKNQLIAERLASTDEHFVDAENMAMLINRIWPNTDKKEKEELTLATLCHDIGKSGPLNADEEMRYAYKTLFVHNTLKASVTLPIAEVIKQENFPDQENLIRILREKLDIDPDRESMIDFFRRHADNTWDILHNSKDINIPEEVAKIAASHHIMDGKNPANIDIENIPEQSTIIEMTDKYTLLTMIDKYQAFMGRGTLTHAQAIGELKNMIDRNKILSETAKEQYRNTLQKISDAGQEAMTRQMAA